MAKDSVSVSVSLKTFSGWKCRLDPGGHWLMADECDGAVTRIYCRLCAKFADRLKSSSRNFSQQFVTGITGSSMKKELTVVLYYRHAY
jgi:hypothetical protein